MQPPQLSLDIRSCGPRPVKKSSAPSCTIASLCPARAGAQACAVPTIVGAVAIGDVDHGDRAADEIGDERACPVLLMAIPRGALPGMCPAGGFSRSTRTIWLGPATSGAPMVGMPLASTVSRTTRFAFWITDPRVGAVRPPRHAPRGSSVNSRGAGVVARLMPWFRFSGAVWRTPAPRLAGGDLGARRGVEDRDQALRHLIEAQRPVRRRARCSPRRPRRAVGWMRDRRRAGWETRRSAS